ncbi:MAG: hypothetical protein NC332_01920 [Firmicutes bacterium]|nr:hypothetical protein [Bacillota bacterium]
MTMVIPPHSELRAMWYWSYAYIALLFSGKFSGFDYVVLLIVILYLVFMIIALVKTILMFVSVIKHKQGKKLYTEAQYNKKLKMTAVIWIWLVMTPTIYFFSYFATYLPYTLLIMGIADAIITKILKKSLKKDADESAFNAFVEASGASAPATEQASVAETPVAEEAKEEKPAE